MQRREFLSRLAVAAGGIVCNARQAASFTPQERSKSQNAAPSVKSIRGLIERNGRFFQPVSIVLPPENKGAAEGKTAVIRINGVQQTLVAGTGVLEVLTPAVEAERMAQVTVEIAGSSVFRGTVALRPVRKALIYVLPHSHNDVGYTDIQTNVEKKTNAQYPAGDRSG